MLAGADGARIVQLSNRRFRLGAGLDPIKNMRRDTFVLTLVPVGRYGSQTAAALRSRDFLRRGDQARPRGHAVARTWHCSPAGRCLSIRLEYGNERVPADVLASINRALRFLRQIR
jgi:hypothetical protein